MGLCRLFLGELMLEQQLPSLCDETCWDLRGAWSRFSGLGPNFCSGWRRSRYAGCPTSPIGILLPQFLGLRHVGPCRIFVHQQHCILHNISQEDSQIIGSFMFQRCSITSRYSLPICCGHAVCKSCPKP